LEKNRDLLWLSKEYENFELPKEKKYLLKYFKSDIQAAFLKYYFVFGNFDNFKEHTGFDCQHRWLLILQNKLQKLESMRIQARADMDMTLLAKIEAGKIRKL
jgi:hypothetical protein